MAAKFLLNDIAWKRILFLLSLTIIPNYLIMQVQIGGSANNIVGLVTALDFVIFLPLALYFFGFRKRVPWLVLGAFIFWGLLLANWIIPFGANAYLTYFNRSVIVFEAGIIVLELVLFTAVIKRLPSLLKNYKKEKNTHYHFLLSFSAAIKNTFSFKNKKLNTFQFVLHILATDISVIYYSLFSWRKKEPIIHKGQGRAFTFHKDGDYLGVFFMLLFTITCEIIVLHIFVSYFISPTAAWVLTVLDTQALLFIISDYQAIRLSPVVLDSKGINFQKGIRQYGFISWCVVNEVTHNTKTLKEVDKDRKGITLALHGFEKKQIPYVIKLKEPIEIRQIFGFKKTIQSIYVKMDDVQGFNETVHSYLFKDHVN